MNSTVIPGSRNCRSVFAPIAKNLPGLVRKLTAVRIVAASAAVPATSGWNENTAAYAFPYNVRKIPLFRLGIAILTCPLPKSLKYDHRIIISDSTIHGHHARNATLNGGLSPASLSPTFTLPCAAGGFHNFRKPATAAIETSELTTSVGYGPHRFETRNCVTPKLRPATSAAGQLRRSPLPPPTTTARYAGRMNDKKGSCLPTIAESLLMSSPVTPESATIGTPRLPKATGAVFAMSETITAFRGANPKPTSKNAVTATGAPNPALPSSSAPKQNATKIACTHASPDA